MGDLLDFLWPRTRSTSARHPGEDGSLQTGEEGSARKQAIARRRGGPQHHYRFVRGRAYDDARLGDGCSHEGSGQEVAALVAFVAGPKALYIPGANLTVDGGTNA